MGDMIQVPFGNGARVSRFAPVGPVQAYLTYGWSMPQPTHWVPASCEDIDCDAWRMGWVTSVDLSTELGQRQYHYITHDKTRSYTETRTGGTIVDFTFPPGTPCFVNRPTGDGHQRPVGKPPVFYRRDGDWRGGQNRYIHTRPEDWVDDFATHTDRLAAEIQKG